MLSSPDARNTPPRSSLLLRWSRPLLAVYAATLLLLLHWPGLELDPRGYSPIAPQLIIHAGAFALLTALLAAAAIGGRHRSSAFNALAAGACAGVLGYLDQLLQGPIGSPTSIAAVHFANQAGVLGAVWALLLAGEQARTRGLVFAARFTMIATVPLVAFMAFYPGFRPVTGNVFLHELGLPLTIDKLAHAGLCCAGTWVMILARPAGFSRPHWSAVVAVLFMLSIGPLVEVGQYFTGRHARIRDVVIDDLGISVAVAGVLLVVWGRWYGRRKGLIEPTLLPARPLPMSVYVEQPGAKALESEPDAADTANAATLAPSPPPAAAGSEKHSFVGNARTVSVLTFISRLTGLGRDAVQARLLGQGAVADSFAYGFQMPNLFRRLFGEGALTAAFIPVYTELLERDRDLATRFASLCLMLLTALLGVLTIVGELALWGIWARCVHSPDTELTVRLTMIMLPYMMLVCLVAVFGAVLQVHGRFAPSAAQPILLNVVMVAAMYWALAGVRGEGAMRLAVPVIAWSVVVAGLWQCWTQGSLMFRYAPLSMRFAGTVGPLRTMLTTMLPTLIALSVFQLNTFVDTQLAYFLAPREGSGEKMHLLGMVLNYPVPQGGLAALFRSQLLYQFPLGVFGISIATAIFPALAQAAVARQNGAEDRFRTILQHGLRLTVFIGLPASVGLLMVRLPVCRVLFEGRKFSLQDSQLCAMILAAYAPAIWAYSMTHVLTRAFYAVKDTRTPMAVSIAMVVLNLMLNLTLVWPLGVAGLAFSTAICAIIQCVIMVRLIGRHVERPVDRGVLTAWGRTAVLSVVMAVTLAPIILWFKPEQLSRRGSIIELAAMVVVGTAVFLAGAWVLRSPEIGWLAHRGKKQ